MNLLLIRGLGHSGTTILDLALGAHPAVTGVGEAVRILERPQPGEEHKGPAQLRGELRHSRLCTCGRVAARCPVWGPTLEWLVAHDQRPLVEKFERLASGIKTQAGGPSGFTSAHGLEHGSEHSSKDWLVDSYQSDLAAPTLPWSRGEVRTLFLVRDVRSWVHSRSSRREKPAAAWRALARWLRTNRQMEKVLRGNGRPLFILGYEELALEPEASLRKVCAWLQLPFDPAMLSPGSSSTSHILAGNRLRFDPERCASIRYDGRWLAEGAMPVAIAAQLPPLRTLNRRLVYGNGVL